MNSKPKTPTRKPPRTLEAREVFLIRNDTPRPNARTSAAPTAAQARGTYAIKRFLPLRSLACFLPTIKAPSKAGPPTPDSGLYAPAIGCVSQFDSGISGDRGILGSMPNPKGHATPTSGRSLTVGIATGESDAPQGPDTQGLGSRGAWTAWEGWWEGKSREALHQEEARDRPKGRPSAVGLGE